MHYDIRFLVLVPRSFPPERVVVTSRDTKSRSRIAGSVRANNQARTKRMSTNNISGSSRAECSEDIFVPAWFDFARKLMRYDPRNSDSRVEPLAGRLRLFHYVQKVNNKRINNLNSRCKFMALQSYRTQFRDLIVHFVLAKIDVTLLCSSK